MHLHFGALDGDTCSMGGFANGVGGDARVVTFLGAISATGDLQNNAFSVIDLLDGFRCLQLFVVSNLIYK